MVKVICPLILKLKEIGEDNLKLPTLLDELEEEIVDAYDGEIEMRSFKGSWIKKITTAASLLNIHLVSVKNEFFLVIKVLTRWPFKSTGTPSWRNIEQKIALKSDTTPSETEAVSTSEANSTSNNHTTRSQVSKSSSSPLKVKLTATDKQAIKANFEKLDSLQFWTLEATVAQAAREGIEAISVEQKVIEFALSCNYHQ